MSGLLLKDLLIFRNGWKLYALLVVFFGVFSFAGNSTHFSSMMTFILMMQPLSSFSSDELARWDKYAAALPGGRKRIVTSKYQLLFLVIGAAFVLTCLVDLLVILFDRAEGMSGLELVVVSLTCALVGLLLNLILYPFLFKFGSQKARLILGLAFGIVFAGAAMGMVILSFSGSTIADVIAEIVLYVSPVLLAAAIVVLLALVLAASYWISCRIYEKKEF